MKYIFFCFIALNIIACTSQKESYTQEQLYEKMSSGVVLVQNTYNYKVSNEKYSSYYILTTRDRYTCHKYDYQTYDSIKENYNNTIYGTGFFLNNKQTIITNSHVINPTIDTVQLCNSIKAHLINEIEKHTKLLDANIELKSYCINKLSNNESLSNLEREFFNKCDEYIKTQRDISTELLKELQDEDFEKNYKIRIDAQIGVALNGNKISSNKDFEKVTVIKDVPNYDLGIIQIADGSNFWNVCKLGEAPKWSYEQMEVGWSNIHNAGTISWFTIPQDKYIFNLYNNETHNDEEIKLYMIGFNQGPTLALTNNGIKAQITQGYISQNTDNIKIMYSIPALQGSSGSPVVNQYGELVAINFAGINGTQGFNYGIRVERLREIVNDQSVKDRMTVYQSKNKPINNDSINSIESINN